MNYADTLKAILQYSCTHEEALDGGMVYQVFEDGEITLQKGGSLLWQRTLHCVTYGCGKSMIYTDMPHQMQTTPHGYMFVRSDKDALAVRELIKSMT